MALRFGTAMHCYCPSEAVSTVELEFVSSGSCPTGIWVGIVGGSIPSLRHHFSIVVLDNPNPKRYNFSMSKTRRTPAEIIAETEAKLSRLRVKQAKKDASSNPAVAALLAELEDLRKDIREAQKGLGDGPQSFNASIVKHEVWINKIEEKRELAETILGGALDRKIFIEAEIASVINSLVSETPNQNKNYA
mgnify:FL=1